MTRIVVSGATGFVGSALTKRLRGREGTEVVALSSASGDVAEPQTWHALPPAEVVVHLAARTFVPDSWTDPAAFLRTNFTGATQALEYCRKHKARLVFLSSYLYGNPSRLPIDEQAPISTPNPYALSKKLAEDACRFYSESFGVEVTILRVFNIYGGGQGDKFLIPLIVRQVLDGSDVHVKDLAPKRDFLFIDDLIEAIVCAVDKPQRFEIFNIASGTSHSVQDVIDIVQRVAGRSVPVHSEEVRRQNEIMETLGDITKARQMLGWTPRWTIESGVQELMRVGV
ncbi:MAG TPA: NAD(P)-dependent oxidoreductase [Steroidobacteraceae bacterium]